MEKFVIQSGFIGSHGRYATQFFGGISTGSGSPTWVNLPEEAIHYDTRQQAQSVLDLRIHSRRTGHSYDVVSLKTDQ